MEKGKVATRAWGSVYLFPIGLYQLFKKTGWIWIFFLNCPFFSMIHFVALKKNALGSEQKYIE